VLEAATRTREQWLERRRRGIGGSDAAAILGVSPFANAIDVWRDKLNLAGPREVNEQMWWGSALEPVILQRYAMKSGHQIYRPGLIEHPKHGCLLGTPDAIVADQKVGVEAKTARTAEGWGDPGTDQVPHPYLVQCLHYMAVADFPAWDLAVLIGASDFRVYRIHRDLELEAEILERLVAWWERHVVHGEQPELDGSESARRFVHDRYPHDVHPLTPAPPEAARWAERLTRARTAYGIAEAEKMACETNLKSLIGDAQGLQGEGWRATWRSTAPRRTTDWEDVVRALAAAYNIPATDVEKAITARTRETAIRRFLFTMNGGE